jgi:hypothetical protein
MQKRESSQMKGVPKIAARLGQYVYCNQRRGGQIERPTYPFRMTGSALASPLTTLKILTVLSDEHVASRLP